MLVVRTTASAWVEMSAASANAAEMPGRLMSVSMVMVSFSFGWSILAFVASRDAAYGERRGRASGASHDRERLEAGLQGHSAGSPSVMTRTRSPGPLAWNSRSMRWRCTSIASMVSSPQSPDNGGTRQSTTVP
jgi:hypothetical protein